MKAFNQSTPCKKRLNAHPLQEEGCSATQAGSFLSKRLEIKNAILLYGYQFFFNFARDSIVK